MIVAMDVAMAILTARSGATPRWDMMMVMKGTINMPPPMPSKPARKPVPMPRSASSTISRGSRYMGRFAAQLGAEHEMKKAGGNSGT